MSRRTVGKGKGGGADAAGGPGQRRSRKALAALAAGIVAVALGLVIYSATSGQIWSGGGRDDGPLTAAIVDQLSLTAPNPEFAEEAAETLEDSGYTVDYFAGDEVTVDFYRSLPARGYELLILRTHSARLRQEWQGTMVDEVILFTNEPYSQEKYIDEQEAGRLSIARYYKDSEPLFGIAPDFIRSSTVGGFEDTTIVLMGCEGLGSEATADAFVQAGAKSVISWSGLVSAAHTDAATEELLSLLVTDELPTSEAVAQTMSEVGPDPTYGSELLAFPVE